MMDPLIADLMAYIEDQHAATGFQRNPRRLCERLDIQYLAGPRHLARSGQGGDLIMVAPEDYQSRLLFTVAHEVAHVLMVRGGYRALIQHHHSSVPNMRAHLEKLANHGAGLLLMPSHDLVDARRRHGETPKAVLHLVERCGASEAAAMRRWVWQDVGQARAAFTVQGRYVDDVICCRARLPFVRWDRVPELPLTHPELSVLSLGAGRVLGTVAW